MAFDGTLKFDTSIDKSGFESGLGKIGEIAKAGMAAVAGAVAAAAGAMAALGTKALAAYADYEQLTGGVATLFGAQDMSLEEYAASVGKTVDAVKGDYDKLISAQADVMANAAEAFRTAGLSQNAYMETVTSFSAALIASLGGDTAKAAEVADKAIIDMADNANKMGSSMESIQNAYQGFAKQNYTMLDNLKLGYGGTRSEMERLLADAEKISGIHYNIESYADVVEAIHVIQTEMGITGTTAREAAETISGSVSMTKAAFSNLLVGIADDEQDFEKLVNDLVESASAAAGNILPRVETIIGGLGKLISSMSGVAADMIVGLTAYIPDLIAAGVSLIDAIVDGLMQNLYTIEESVSDVVPAILDGILSVAPDLVTIAQQLIRHFLGAIASSADSLAGAAAELGAALIGGLHILIADLAETADLLMEAFASSLTEKMPAILPIAQNLILSIAETFRTYAPYIIDAAVQITDTLLGALLDPAVLTAVLDAALQIILSLAQALLDNIPQLVETVSALITNVIDFIAGAVPMLLDAAVQLFMSIVDALPQVIDALAKELPRILTAITGLIPQIVSAIARALPQIVNVIVQAIPAVVQALMQALPQMISALTEALLSMNSQLLEAAVQLFRAILEALPVIAELLIPMIPEIMSEIADILTASAPQLLEAAGIMFMAIADAVPEVIESLTVYFGEMLSVSEEWLGKIFAAGLENMKTGFSNMIGSAKQLASDLVNGAMQFLNALPAEIGTMLGTALGHIVQFAAEAPQKAKDAASEFLENVVEFFSDLPGSAKEWLDSTIEKVTEWASDLAKKGREGAADLVQKIETEISALPQKMLDAGRNLVEGLWNGITSMGDWLRSKISEFAGGIISGFKDAFGIESPSKIMRDSVGRYLAEGLGIGFTDEIPEIGSEALAAFSNLELPEISISAELHTDMPEPDAPEPPDFEFPALPEIPPIEFEIPEPDFELPALPEIPPIEFEIPEPDFELPALPEIPPIEFEIPELPELTVRTAEFGVPELRVQADRLPQIDSDAVRMLQAVREHPASGLVQPPATSEITNNYYSYGGNKSGTKSEQPVINVHVHVDTEMDGDKIAEKVAERVDILQGDAVMFEERGTVH